MNEQHKAIEWSLVTKANAEILQNWTSYIVNICLRKNDRPRPTYTKIWNCNMPCMWELFKAWFMNNVRHVVIM